MRSCMNFASTSLYERKKTFTILIKMQIILAKFGSVSFSVSKENADFLFMMKQAVVRITLGKDS